jgi:hypothetical protein
MCSWNYCENNNILQVGQCILVCLSCNKIFWTMHVGALCICFLDLQFSINYLNQGTKRNRLRLMLFFALHFHTSLILIDIEGFKDIKNHLKSDKSAVVKLI